MSLGSAANTGLIVTSCVFLLPIIQFAHLFPGTNCAFCLNLHILSVSRHGQSRRDIRPALQFLVGILPCQILNRVHHCVSLPTATKTASAPTFDLLEPYQNKQCHNSWTSRHLYYGKKRKSFRVCSRVTVRSFQKWWVAQIIGPLCPSGNPLSERVHNKPQSGMVQLKGPALFVMTFIVCVNQASHQTSYCWRGSRISV